MSSRTDQVVNLLQAIETQDQDAFACISPRQYVQHNLSMRDGRDGLFAMFGSEPATPFKARVARVFEDGDYVVAHTAYDFFGPKVGFDVFRFDDDLIVEHWDNLAVLQPPNRSGRTQLDGADEISDRDKTEDNKRLVRTFFEENILRPGGRFGDYLHPQLLQHNPDGSDGLDGLAEYFRTAGRTARYDVIHRVLGEGNFVLLMSEGVYGDGAPTAFYDLFRVHDQLLVEHWDVLEKIPPKELWSNANGKF